MDGESGVNRRTVLKGAAAGAAGLWLPTFKVTPARSADCMPPPRFPADIPIYRQGYENWSTAIKIDEVWTCAPRSVADAVRVVNWALEHGYRARPRGNMHNWSPIMVNPGDGCASRIVLIDTQQGLTGLSVDSEAPPAVRVGAGETLGALLAFCEQHGYGATPVPAPGSITIGGLMAIGAHGTSLPLPGEDRAHHAYGSMANMVESLEAIVWSRKHRRYVLRRFDRDHPDAKALLVHLGRAFVTSYVLRVGANRNLRCVSRTDISAGSLFDRGGGDQSFRSILAGSGRIETIQFPFSEYPWLKVWSIAESRPPSSRQVTEPYNYPFSDNLPREMNDLADRIIRGEGAATPLFGQTAAMVSSAGLVGTGGRDLWGAAKNLQLYIKASTLRYGAWSFAIITRRNRVQRVVSELSGFFNRRIADYADRGLYPVNGPVEIRVSGIDRTRSLAIPGAEPPILSSASPRPGRDWDAVVWISILTFPDTTAEFPFFAELEAFTYRNFRGWAEVRPEWSKGWAYTDTACWSNRRTLKGRIPRAFTAGRAPGNRFDDARRRLNRYDPHRVYSSRLLDRLLP